MTALLLLGSILLVVLLQHGSTSIEQQALIRPASVGAAKPVVTFSRPKPYVENPTDAPNATQSKDFDQAVGNNSARDNNEDQNIVRNGAKEENPKAVTRQSAGTTAANSTVPVGPASDVQRQTIVPTIASRGGSRRRSRNSHIAMISADDREAETRRAVTVVLTSDGRKSDIGYSDDAHLCARESADSASGYKVCVSDPAHDVPVFGVGGQIFAIGIYQSANLSYASMQRSWSPTWFLRVDRMLKYMEKRANLSHFALNIGANDGKTLGPDPTYQVFHWLQFSGVCVEPDPVAFSKLRRNIPHERVKKVNAGMTPGQVPEFCEKYNVPQFPDIIKIDIDSFDCDLLEAFVRARQFKLIHTEINYEIPVPLMFARKWSPQIRFCMRPFAFYSCSFSYQVHMLSKYGYTLLQLWGFDATFIHESVKHVFPENRYLDPVQYFYSTPKINAGIEGKTTGHLKHPKRKWRWRANVMNGRMHLAWNSILEHYAEAATDCAGRKHEFKDYVSALHQETGYHALTSDVDFRNFTIRVLNKAEADVFFKPMANATPLPDAV